MPDRGYRSFARLILLSLPFLAASEARAFGFEDVDARAKELAAAPFSRAGSALPRELQGISYDQYRDIRFRRNRFLWNRAKLPFEVAFFHPGWLYDQPVKISEIVNDAVREIKFDPESFEYGSNKIDPAKLRDLGFAGFRVHYSLNTPRFKDEVLVFLGASYLRALGKSQLYGLSARGLAIDTAAGEDGLIGRQRQRQLLQQTAALLQRSMTVMSEGEELAAEELRAAALSLGRLLGRVDVEDILDAIFRDFCIGK